MSGGDYIHLAPAAPVRIRRPLGRGRIGRTVHKTLRNRAFCAVAALLVAGVSAYPRARTTQSDYWFTPDLSPYRALVDVYREGRTAEAVDGVLALEAEALVQIADTVRDLDTRVTGTDRYPDANERVFRAAAMLHVDAADALSSMGRERAATFQIELATRWADFRARSPEPDGSFRRRWYRGVGLLLFDRLGWRDALSFVDRACEAVPDDVPLLTIAAWLHEQVALAPASLERGGAAGLREAQGVKRRGLRAAARRANAALAVSADATEAALRLARVRMLLGEAGAAREALLGLVGRTDVPTPHAYLARLMLGQLYAAAEPGRAERLFREAGDLLPEGQAARVALGQLLDTQGNRRGAAAVLGLSAGAEQDSSIDPWVDYLMGVGNGPGQAEALRDEVRQ